MRAPTPPASNETAQYADEEDNTRDRYPRRLRGTLPESRRWWIPGLKYAWDTWKEIQKKKMELGGNKAFREFLEPCALPFGRTFCSFRKYARLLVSLKLAN